MKITNFKFTNRFGTSPTSWSFRATVDVTTDIGFLFWKSTIVETKEIYKNYAGYWYWSDTGDWTPDEVDSLVRSWEAENECPLENYIFPKD